MARLTHLLARIALGAGALAASGCYADDTYYDPAYCQAGIEDSSIDTGSVLILDPGLVGATAEYFGDGAWRFATACDTALSGVRCDWQFDIVPLEGSIDYLAPENLEGEDVLGQRHDGSVFFDPLTDFDIDAMTLEATPGATLEVSVGLDGDCGGSFFFWLDGGQAPGGLTGMVDLTPSEP